MCILNVMSLYFLRLWVFFLNPERAWGFSRDRLFEKRRYGGTFSMSCFFFFFFFFKTSIPIHFASHTHHIDIQNLSFTNPRQTHQVHSFSQQTTTATTKNTPKRIYIFIWHYGNHNVSTYWLHRCFLFFFSVSALKYRRDGGFLFYMLSSMASKDPKS